MRPTKPTNLFVLTAPLWRRWALLAIHSRGVCGHRPSITIVQRHSGALAHDVTKGYSPKMDHDCKLNFGCCWNYRTLSYRVDGAADRWVGSKVKLEHQACLARFSPIVTPRTTCPITSKRDDSGQNLIMLILTYRGLMTLMSSKTTWMLTLTEKKKYIFMYIHQ